jgi:hypothetical protein
LVGPIIAGRRKNACDLKGSFLVSEQVGSANGKWPSVYFHSQGAAGRKFFRAWRVTSLIFTGIKET